MSSERGLAVAVGSDSIQRLDWSASVTGLAFMWVLSRFASELVMEQESYVWLRWESRTFLNGHICNCSSQSQLGISFRKVKSLDSKPQLRQGGRGLCLNTSVPTTCKRRMNQGRLQKRQKNTAKRRKQFVFCLLALNKL